MDKRFPYMKSNRDVIDELTKDVEEACAIATGEERESWGYTKGTADEKKTDEKKTDETEKEEDGKQPAEDVDEDSVIELNLKDRDLNLTDEEKEQLKVRAEKLKNDGNEFFRNKEFHKALECYSQGLRKCPLIYSKERSILFANRAAAKSSLQLEKSSAIHDCSKAIELDSNYLKAYIRRAHLYEELNKLDEALEDFKKIVELDPSNSDAQYAVRRLPPMIEERNEKLKTEMIGKLKDLGNLFLKPFGLSTNNFQVQKDDGSGGYSVKFNQGQT